MRHLIVLAVTAAMATAAHAQNDQDNCWVQAGLRYNVSPHALVAIATQESKLNAGAINVNKNGTVDYGLMGINTVWLKQLSQFGITEQHLMQPCINVHIGAWIYSQHVRSFGNTWRAIGAYHSKTPSLSSKYVSAIQRHYLDMLTKPRVADPRQGG
jgi:soluble lytic murein transglycosylase-like protein